MRTLTVPPLLVLAAITGCQKSPAMRTDQSTPDTNLMATPTSAPSYQIDGAAVTRAEFERFLAKLGPETNTQCAETTTGGIASYDAADAAGVYYRVERESGGRQRQIIRRRELPDPLDRR
jgi:hypothetical protein